MKIVKIIILSFITGVAVGFTTVYFIFYQPALANDVVKTTPISGEKIAHESFDFTGKKFTFKTISEGKGEVLTEIPKTLIPEADNWINRNQSITLSYGYMFDSDGVSPYFGVMYMYRCNRISFGGGADLSYNFIGVKASASICW